MSKLLDKITIGLFLAVLVFTALAHGAVESWAQALGSAGIVAVLFLWIFKACVEQQWTIRVPSLIWPLLAFIALGLMQSIAWTEQSGRRASLSLDVEASRETVLWLVLLVLAFVLAANLFASQGRLSLLRSFSIYFGLALALFALLQKATWNGRFYWWRTVDTQIVIAPFGPFVHHGHYAGYLELLLPIPLAFLIAHQMRFEKKLLYGFAAAIMGVSIVASLARGGMLSLTVELIFLAVMSIWIKRKQRSELGATASLFQSLFIRAGAVIIIAVMMFIGVLWIGIEPIMNRVTLGQGNGSAQTFFNDRGWVWRDTLTMFRAHPVTGVGLGAFETAFPIYSQSDGSLTVSAAHNDYLQILAEGGIIGGALMIWFIVMVFRLLHKALQSHDTRMQALALGSGAGLVGILVHSFFDFNLQLPSHALLFLTLVAVVATLGAWVVEGEAAMAAKTQPQPNYFDLTERLSERGTL